MWVCAADYADDLRIGPEILKTTVDTYRKLRNTLRWMLGNLAHFHAADRVAPEKMPELERLMLHRLAELDPLVRQAYADFDYKRIFAALNAFMTVDLSAFYFDIRKDALYCDPYSSVTRKACLTVLDHLFRATVIWLAPMLCFTAEEAWLARDPAAQSVHLEPFPQVPPSWRDDALAEKWRKLRNVRRVVTGALELERAAKRIGSSLEARPSSMSPMPICSPPRSTPILPNCASPRRRRWSKARGRLRLSGSTDVPGVAVVPRWRRGQEMRAVVENLASRRPRSAISRRHAARRPGAARMGSHAQGGRVGPAGHGGCGAKSAGEVLCLGAAERLRACHCGDRLRSSIRPRSSGCSTTSIWPIAARSRLTPFIDLVLTWNTGISYGLFPQQGPLGQWALLAFKVAAVVFLWVWLARAPSRLTAVALGPDHRRRGRQCHRPAALAGSHGFCAVPHRDGRLELPLVRL